MSNTQKLSDGLYVVMGSNDAQCPRGSGKPTTYTVRLKTSPTKTGDALKEARQRVEECYNHVSPYIIPDIVSMFRVNGKRMETVWTARNGFVD